MVFYAKAYLSKNISQDPKERIEMYKTGRVIKAELLSQLDNVCSQEGHEKCQRKINTLLKKVNKRVMLLAQSRTDYIGKE